MHIKQFGFLGDPRKWVGKTIEVVEIISMEFSANSSSAILVKFTDGSRGWSAGHGNCDNIVAGPRLEDLAKSQILTADEYGQMIADQKRRADARIAEDRRRKEAEFARLQKELGK